MRTFANGQTEAAKKDEASSGHLPLTKGVTYRWRHMWYDSHSSVGPLRVKPGDIRYASTSLAHKDVLYVDDL